MVLRRRKKKTDEPDDPVEESESQDEKAVSGPNELDEKDQRLVEDMEAVGGLEAGKQDGMLVDPLVEDRRPPHMLRKVLPGLAVAGGIGVLELARLRFQQSQTFLPDRYPNGIWDPSPYGVEASDVWFESEDQTQLHGWWMPYKRARGTVIYCHGNSGNITNRIGVFRYLRRLRLNVFAFDYRGYGRSDGKPTEAGVFADTRAAHKHVVESIGESEERILLFGHSLGGAIAIDCATHCKVAGLVAQSTFTSLKDMARVRFPSWPMHWIASDHFRSMEKVRSLEIPKLFIHGTSDETIPFEIGERLFEAAADPKEWYVVPYAGHNDVYRFGGFRYLWKISRFSKRCLS